MKIKKVLSITLMVLILMTMLLGCGDKGDSNNPTADTSGGTDTQKGKDEGINEPKLDKIKFTATSFDVIEDGNYEDDEIYKTLSEKFNFEYELIPLSWDNWVERDRVWINSGDMPDLMFWDFDYNDYINYAKQGLIKELPKDYETKYPNLARSIGVSGIDEYLKEKLDDTLYMIPHVIYLDLITEVPIDAMAVYYRKDWADKLGIKIGDSMTVEELIDLAKEFAEKDPGGNGSGNTIGISSTGGYLCDAFVKTYNSYFAGFYEKDGQYTWGPYDDSTLEGIKLFKDIYSQGLIDKDFYTMKGTEYLDKFNAGLAGIFFYGCSADNLDAVKKQFLESNPGIDPNEAIDVCVITAADGKYHGHEVLNFWSASIFNPDIEDEKLDRILNIFDYLVTEEGQRLVRMGIEGEDYQVSGDEITITREKDENGEFKRLSDIYPSYNYFSTKAILPDDWSIKDPSIHETTRDQVKNLFKYKDENAALSRIDLDLLFLETPNKKKFAVKVDDAITECILDSRDPKIAWEEWLKSMEPKVTPVLEEINEHLAK